jgi:hypothetical protein
MVQNVNATFVKTPNWGAVTISTGSVQNTPVTVYTGGVNGSKIPALIACTFATTAAFDLSWGISSGGSFFVHGTASVPAGAGNGSATPAVNLMSNSNVPLAIDSDGNPFVFLPSSAYSLQARFAGGSSLWTTTAIMQIIAPSVGDF